MNISSRTRYFTKIKYITVSEIKEEDIYIVLWDPVGIFFYFKKNFFIPIFY